MKKLIAPILVLCMLLSLTACGKSDENTRDPQTETGLLRAASRNDIATMDVTQTTDSYMVPMNVYDRLFEVQPGGSSEIVPSLCVEHSVSEDGRTYRFTLRDKVVFSNGNPLTSEDVQYSFERLLTSPTGINSDVALEVQGAAELREGKSDRLAGFAIEDDLHFSITLSAPNAGFLAELTGPAMSIVDAESMRQAKNFGSDVKETIGTGAYRITEWVVNDHYVLEYNDKYWGEEPSVKKVIVSIIPDPSTQNLMYQKGELDILDLEGLDSAILQSTYKTQYRDRLLSASRVGVCYMALNADQQYLSDVRVRKAVQMAIDVDTIIASVFAGDAQPEPGIIPSGVWGHNPGLARPAFDPAGARQLLKDAGYRENQVTFELAMDSSSSSNQQLMYQIIQQNLKDVGINAQLKTYDSSSWLDTRKAGKLDSFLSTWTMDFNDPANIMDTFFGSESNTRLRSLNYKDKDVIRRVHAASSITDDAARMAEYQALEEKIVLEDAAWVPLLSNQHLFALGERVESFVPYWAGYSDFYVRTVVLK